MELVASFEAHCADEYFQRQMTPHSVRLVDFRIRGIAHLRAAAAALDALIKSQDRNPF